MLQISPTLARNNKTAQNKLIPCDITCFQMMSAVCSITVSRRKEKAEIGEDRNLE